MPSAVDAIPFWLIHVGWTIAGFGMGLGYSAHAQLDAALCAAASYGTATASLQLFDNLGIALGAGATGVDRHARRHVGWDPGAGVAVALIGPATLALIGIAVTRRLPRA